MFIDAVEFSCHKELEVHHVNSMKLGRQNNEGISGEIIFYVTIQTDFLYILLSLVTKLD